MLSTRYFFSCLPQTSPRISEAQSRRGGPRQRKSAPGARPQRAAWRPRARPPCAPPPPRAAALRAPPPPWPVPASQTRAPPLTAPAQTLTLCLIPPQQRGRPRWAGQPNLGGVGQGRLTSEAARWYCCACSAAACACACAARSCACSAACCCRICACICACSWRWKATCAICAPACARPHDRTHVTAPHPLSPSVQQKIILLPRHEAETLNTYFQKDAWLASQPLCQRAQGEAQTRQQQEWSAGERPRGARGGAPAAAAPSAAAGAARRRP